MKKREPDADESVVITKGKRTFIKRTVTSETEQPKIKDLLNAKYGDDRQEDLLNALVQADYITEQEKTKLSGSGVLTMETVNDIKKLIATAKEQNQS